MRLAPFPPTRYNVYAMGRFMLAGQKSDLRPGMAVKLRDGSCWLVASMDVVGNRRLVILDLKTASLSYIIDMAYGKDLKSLDQMRPDLDICHLYKDHLMQRSTWDRPKEENKDDETQP